LGNIVYFLAVIYLHFIKSCSIMCLFFLINSREKFMVMINFRGRKRYCSAISFCPPITNWLLSLISGYHQGKEKYFSQYMRINHHIILLFQIISTKFLPPITTLPFQRILSRQIIDAFFIFDNEYWLKDGFKYPD